MPSSSRSEQIAWQIAEHHPEKLYKRNRGMLGATPQQMHDFASGSEKGKPYKKNLLRRKKNG